MSRDITDLFEIIFPVSHFCDTALGFQYVFFAYAFATVVHQGHIYLSYNKMTETPQYFESTYKNWFNTKCELSIRLFAFFVLLIVEGKVEFILNIVTLILFHTHKTRYTAGQYIVVLGTALFFLLGVMWDVCAKIKSKKKWSDPEHRKFLISDLLAFLFWFIISIFMLSGCESLGNISLIPVCIAVFYIFIIFVRTSEKLYRFLK